MKLLMDKRPFSWDNEYEITYEDGAPAYRVLATPGKKKNIITLFNKADMELGRIEMKKKLFSPSFEIIFDDRPMGSITKDFTFVVTRYVLHLSRWRMFGTVMAWEFDILDEDCLIMHAGTEGTPHENSEKYLLDVYYDNNEIPALLAALGMEAANSTLGKR